MGFRVGVDIGGTFTDFCVFDESTGALSTLKVLSRPDKPGAEIMTGLAKIAETYGIEPPSISYFTHGTTVGVNTVIQRKGVNLCLFAKICDRHMFDAFSAPLELFSSTSNLKGG